MQFSSVAWSCLTLCDPMNHSTPGFPIRHQLPESTQTHVHWVGDAIQPSHLLSSPFPPALNRSSIRVFSNESALRIRWPKYWSFSFNISPSNEHPEMISFRIDWLDLLAVQGSLKCSSWVQSQKQQNDLCSFPRQIIHYHSNPSLCLSYQCQRSWSWTVLWRPTRPSRTNTKKRCPLIIGDWNAKGGNEEIPRVTGKFGLEVQNEAGQRLMEFCQENALVIANTHFQQHKRLL